MSDELTATIRIRRPAKIVTDDVGNSVWASDIEEVELELVSTMMLEQLLDADEDTVRMKLKDVAASGDGVLAREVGKDDFSFVGKADVEKAVTDHKPPAAGQDTDELSLVSTQMVQVLLEKPHLSPKQVSDELKLLEEAEAAGGFDPYNNS